jgi:hypothetical protein
MSCIAFSLPSSILYSDMQQDFQQVCHSFVGFQLVCFSHTFLKLWMSSSILLLDCPVLLHSPICRKVLPSPLSTHVSVVTVNMMQECFIRNHIMSCLKHMPSADVKNILWHLLINFDISIDFMLQYNLQNCC